MSDASADAVVRGRLADDTLLVLLSDVHIGGAAGSEIFESAAELTGLLEDLRRHPGPVELVLVGDFLDLLRMGDVGHGEELVAATIARSEYGRLFPTLRAFAQAPGHRVVYLVGNHDAELWWNPGARRALAEAGLVDVFGLSYVASFASSPDRLVYGEHGNQFDPANTIVDYANPLDTPVGAHVVTELVRPIGSGAAVTRSIDLRALSHVFPLAALPEWIAGRIFYQFLGQVLRWLLAPLVVAYVLSEGLAVVVRAFGGSLAIRPLFLELTYVLGLLVVAAAVVFLISRGTAARLGSALASGFPGRAPGPGRYREDVAIRRLLADGRPPPMAGDGSRMEIAVFVSGHTHAPGLSALDRADGRRTVIANTGCWLRQLQPVPAWLGAPPVFVPAFVHSHVRVRSGPEGLTVELWNQPRPAGSRLPWIERLAVAGRMPQPPPAGGPRLIARRLVDRAAR
ncbi:MAG TPA: metallophosphoesterase [Actinomycetes bacterium]|nr:metallophosphoesterase [Actinomycetes bacterium]